MIDMKHWQEDPRLKQMDPKKLQYITDFAGRLTSMSKNQLIPALLQLQADAARNHIRFSDSETELLVSILSADMNPAEKKKLETLRFFAKKTGCQVLLTAGFLFLFIILFHQKTVYSICTSGI